MIPTNPHSHGSIDREVQIFQQHLTILQLIGCRHWSFDGLKEGADLIGVWFFEELHLEISHF